MAATRTFCSCSATLGKSLSSAPASKACRITSSVQLAQLQVGAGVLIAAGKALSVEGKKAANFIRCSAADGPSSTTSTAADKKEAQGTWLPVIPTSALPRGERRLIRQDGETVLLLWYKDEVFALENKSPAEGAYSEGLFNARLTPDGCIVCPSTDTTFDLKTGEIKDWYPTNPILAFLTRPTRILEVYPVKSDPEYIYIDLRKGRTGQSAEIVFGGQTQAGKTADDVSVDEVRMVVDDDNESGFGFTPYTELVNGRAALVGIYVVALSELVSGKGFLKGLGLLDFIYQFTK